MDPANVVKLFEFAEPDARPDYLVLSPDGEWVRFDRFQRKGGDTWMPGASAPAAAR